MLPFAAPPPAMPMLQAPMPAPPSPLDPSKLFDQLIESEPDWRVEPPPGWKKPKKKEPAQIWAEAMTEEGRHQSLVNRMLETVARLRFERAGIFPADASARAAGDQDEWKSSALVDDYTMLCAIVASMPESAHKRTLNRSLRLSGQTMEDAARYFREEEIYRWAYTGDMDLRLAEIKVLACYGRLISRHLCDVEDPEYPFEDMLCDPASTYVIPGGSAGPKRIYRVVRMQQGEAFATWGEPRKKDLDKVRQISGDSDDSAIITVCEYADTWYRAAVLKGGVELLPVTEHKYYFVPFVVQGGPAGEPLFTDTVRASADDDQRLTGGWWRSGPMDDWGMEHKLTSSIAAQQERNDQLEAVMARVVTSIQDATDPALIIKRDPLSHGKPLPEIDRRRGRRNEIGMGEDVIPVPTAINPSDMRVVMDELQRSELTGRIPLGMYGNQPGSNITGNSMSVQAESGMDHITPWISAIETYQTRKTEMKFRIWRQKGHLTRFYKGYEQPFLVPTKAATGKDLATELTPEMIDAVGPRVMITKARIRMQDRVQIAQIAQSLVPLGMSRRRIFELMGEEDYDRMREEWQEEVEWEMINQDESMIKDVKIPMRLMAMADEAQTPEERATMMALLDHYMYKQEQAAMPAPMPPTGGPPGMPPGGAPPMGAPSLGGNTMNNAAIGMAPGSAGAPVGRPPGPFGPPQF
jgi:hypothetical protein